MPVVKGRKSETEKFAGAVRSYSIEAMMGDTRALQAGTSHFLGDNFARAFEIRYLDQDNSLQYCWTTSWGLSTRFIGAIIMVHGDDQGLILPPRLAPYQVVIVPIYKNDDERPRVMAGGRDDRGQAADFRVHVDRREGLTPGFKFNDWEMRACRCASRSGPKDVAKGTVALCPPRPARPGGQALRSPGRAEQDRRLDLLDEIHASLFHRADEFRSSHTTQPRRL